LSRKSSETWLRNFEAVFEKSSKSAASHHVMQVEPNCNVGQQRFDSATPHTDIRVASLHLRLSPDFDTMLPECNTPERRCKSATFDVNR